MIKRGTARRLGIRQIDDMRTDGEWCPLFSGDIGLLCLDDHGGIHQAPHYHPPSFWGQS